MARLEGSPIDWSTERRFVCIGGKINRDVISGIRLVTLYEMKTDECWWFEDDNDPRFEGGHIRPHPMMYTVLHPVENKPGKKHTAEGYGFPHVNILMTPEVCAMVDNLSTTRWTELSGMAILADLLEENNLQRS